MTGCTGGKVMKEQEESSCMSRGGRDHWHCGWDVEQLLTELGGTSGVFEPPHSGCC